MTNNLQTQSQKQIYSQQSSNIMQQKIQKIRKIAEDIERKKQNFSTLYSYLDQLEKEEARKQEDSSDDEIDMQKYIAPVRNMLGQYKQSINHIRQNQQMISRSSTDVSNSQNICPNTKNSYQQIENTNTRRKSKKYKNYKQISLKQLDQEISQLTKKLSLQLQ